MSTPAPILVTGAGGGVGRTVVELLGERELPVRALVHHEDERADVLRALGAQVVVGDLTRPADVARALEGVGRMFFSMSVSPEYLEATTVVAAVARERGGLEALVAISQMTVSQMTATSTEESHQQRLHWLSEQVLTWSGLPVVHVRPTIFLDSPLLTTLAARSIAQDGTLALPFGNGRTSPIAASDVAPAGLPSHVQQHLVTMARLHRLNRYDRSTRTVEEITGCPAQSVEEYVAQHAGMFSPDGGASAPE